MRVTVCQILVDGSGPLVFLVVTLSSAKSWAAHVKAVWCTRSCSTAHPSVFLPSCLAVTALVTDHLTASAGRCPPLTSTAREWVPCHTVRLTAGVPVATPSQGHRRRCYHRASLVTFKRFEGDTVLCPIETVAYDLEWGSGDTIIRFGWHARRLSQRESISHGQVPGLCITVMMQFHEFRRGLAPGALRRDHCQSGMVRTAATGLNVRG